MNVMLRIWRVIILVQLLPILLSKVEGKNVVHSKNITDLDFYTVEELQKLPKFRARVKDDLTQSYMNGNRYLVRFLRARNLDLDGAEEAIRENLKWRKLENVDNVLREDVSKWQKQYPFYFNFDHAGRVGLVNSLRDFDTRRITISGQRAEFRRYIMYQIESMVVRIEHVANSTGREIIQANLLFNMAGFNFRTHACFACLALYFDGLEIYEKGYTRLAHGIHVINTPRIFESLYETFKSTVSIHTQRAVHLYGLNRAEWTRSLFKIYPKDQLTLEFGGTMPKRHWKNTVD